MQQELRSGAEPRIAPQLRENHFNLTRQDLLLLTNDRAPLDRERASIGIRAQLAPTFDERRVHRWAAEEWMRLAFDEALFELLEAIEHAAHHHDGVDAVLR